MNNTTEIMQGELF